MARDFVLAVDIQARLKIKTRVVAPRASAPVSMAGRKNRTAGAGLI